MREENNIISHTNPKSPISEAYRALRTNIQFSSADKPLKCIVVTSAGPMEGKTTTVTNLAVTFAQAGIKVLLIDADLRKPKVHKFFKISNDKGLTNYITSHAELMNTVRHDIVKNLDVLTCGIIPPNPSELLNSKAMRTFIDNMKSEYDIILMDSPPVGSVTDASIISTYADGTIIVAKSGKVNVDAVKRAKETLDKVNANILGVVLNNLDKKALGNNYYYYQYYYSDDTADKKRKKNKKKKAEIQAAIDD